MAPAKCADAQLAVGRRFRLSIEPNRCTGPPVFAAQSRQADQKRIIEFLSRESQFPIDEVAHLYEDELAELSIGARIKSFLPIFALRNVQETLRLRSVAARRAGSRGAATLSQ